LSLTLHFVVTALPAGSSFLTDGAMDVVIIRTCLAHGLETPISGRCSQQFSMLFRKITIGYIRRLAAKRGATELYQSGRHIEISLADGA
jgi:hypothetical protein